MGLEINLKLIFRLPEHQQNCYWRGWGVTLSLIFVFILTLGAPLLLCIYLHMYIETRVMSSSNFFRRELAATRISSELEVMKGKF
jgi:hypothetical protein